MLLKFVSRFPFLTLLLALGAVLGGGGYAKRDWIWNNWPAWEDGRWELPFGTLTDVVGIAIGFVVLCLTIYVAFKQLGIMRKQTAMMQTQAEITVKQMEIAETQLKYEQEQLGRTCEVDIRIMTGTLDGDCTLTNNGIVSITVRMVRLRFYIFDSVTGRENESSQGTVASRAMTSMARIASPNAPMIHELTWRGQLTIEPRQALPVMNLEFGKSTTEDFDEKAVYYEFVTQYRQYSGELTYIDIWF